MNDFLIPTHSRERVIERISQFIAALPTRKAYRITIKQEADDRTVQQCRYLNGVPYNLLSEFTGYERDEISKHLCGLYWGFKQVRVPRTQNNPNGIEDRPVRTTTTDEQGHRDVLSTRDFWDYVEFCQRFGAQYGVYIPDPDPSYKLQRDEEQAA